MFTSFNERILPRIVRSQGRCEIWHFHMMLELPNTSLVSLCLSSDINQDINIVNWPVCILNKSLQYQSIILVIAPNISNDSWIEATIISSNDFSQLIDEFQERELQSSIKLILTDLLIYCAVVRKFCSWSPPLVSLSRLFTVFYSGDLGGLQVWCIF